MESASLTGIGGRAFVDLEPYVETDGFEAIDREICFALAQIPTEYTGGAHRSMGIMPESLAGEAHRDYGEVLRDLSNEEFAVFATLADEPHKYDPARRASYGEERALPLNLRQMRWLEYRHGVYFPWKVYLELVPGGRWEDKADPRGKAFTRTAQVHFPRTVAFVRGLPFATIGSVKLLGLAAHDHGTVHRDAVPADKPNPDHFVTFSPKGTKRLFVWDDAKGERTIAPSRAYWFNDSDYHGVLADPFFRYSIRVDGTFTPEFKERLERDLGVSL